LHDIDGFENQFFLTVMDEIGIRFTHAAIPP
jgi:hypothetical protein